MNGLLWLDLVGCVTDDNDHVVTNCQIILDVGVLVQQLEVVVAQEDDRDDLHFVRGIQRVGPYAVALHEGAIIDLLDRLVGTACTLFVVFSGFPWHNTATSSTTCSSQCPC